MRQLGLPRKDILPKNMVFVDTDYFLRYLLRDNDEQFEVAKNLFERTSKGEETVFTSVVVIFEVSWVLESFYGSKKSQIVDTLAKILKMGFIGLSERKQLAAALKIYESSSLGLEDSYNLVYAKNEGAMQFATFDQKLLKKFEVYKKLTTFGHGQA